MKTQTLLLTAAAFGLGWWLFTKKDTATNYQPWQEQLPEQPVVQPGGYVVLPGIPGKENTVFSAGNTATGFTAGNTASTANIFTTTTGISGL